MVVSAGGYLVGQSMTEGSSTQQFHMQFNSGQGGVAVISEMKVESSNSEVSKRSVSDAGAHIKITHNSGKYSVICMVN